MRQAAAAAAVMMQSFSDHFQNKDASTFPCFHEVMIQEKGAGQESFFKFCAVSSSSNICALLFPEFYDYLESLKNVFLFKFAVHRKKKRRKNA